jgi:hypothetical protein
MLLEGTYASYKLTPRSADKLMNWIIDNDITSPTPKEELHVTTTYSRADVDLVPSDKNNIVLNPSGYSIGVLKNALVLHIESDELTKVHDDALDAGATSDYPSYKPHITLSYDAEANEELIRNLVPPTFEITLSHEEIMPLREAFDIWLGYDFWGWIDPNGELILPTKKMQASNMIYTHIRLLPKIRTYGKAFSLNYIRFHIRRNTLTLDLSAATPKDIVQKGYRNIEKFLKTNKKYLKDVFGKDDVNFINFKYELNKPPAKGSPYPDEWDVVVEGDSYRELLRKLPFAGKVDEEFLGLNYSFWGWIKSDGSLLLPTEEMKNSNEHFSHAELIHNDLNIKLYSEGGMYTPGYTRGWIRFHIRKNILSFDLGSNTNIETVTEGYRNIEKYLKTKKSSLKRIFGSDEVNFLSFDWEIFEPNLKRSNYWKFHDTGNCLRTLVSKLRDLQSVSEETPANVTGNIAVADKPLFRPIRRKVSNDIYRKIKSSKKSWKEIVEEYNIEYDNRSPLIVENENGDWMFLKYGTLIY